MGTPFISQKDREQRATKVGWNFPNDLNEAAWGIIANAFGGDWSKASTEWREAAERWRDAYHETIGNTVTTREN